MSIQLWKSNVFAFKYCKFAFMCVRMRSNLIEIKEKLLHLLCRYDCSTLNYNYADFCSNEQQY